MKTFGAIKPALVACLIIIVALTGFVIYGELVRFQPTVETRVEVDSELLESSVRQIARLSTLSHTYTEIGIFEEQASVAIFGFDVNIPGTARSFILRFSGEMKFGIDVSEIELRIDEYVLTVLLPQVQVQSHAIDMESIQLLDERTGLFSSFELEDYTYFIAGRQQEIEVRQATAALIEQARQNAEASIYVLLRTALGSDAHEIIFVWA